MKLFCTSNLSAVEECRHYFSISLPSELLYVSVQRSFYESRMVIVVDCYLTVQLFVFILFIYLLVLFFVFFDTTISGELKFVKTFSKTPI